MRSVACAIHAVVLCSSFSREGKFGVETKFHRIGGVERMPAQYVCWGKTLGLGNCWQLTSFAADLKGDFYTKT
jgi:hypothetical protein